MSPKDNKVLIFWHETNNEIKRLGEILWTEEASRL
jgi:hypothetical protein